VEAMARPPIHNWKLLYREYCLSGYATITAFAKWKHMNPAQVRDEFRKLNGSRKQIEEKVVSEPARPAGRPPSRRQQTTDNREIEDDEPDLADRLTNKQVLFVAYYLIYWNATQAAIEAGYSKHTAVKIGWENLQKPLIQKEIQRQTKILLNSLGITPQRALAEYLKIAFADIGTYVEFGQKEIWMPGAKRGKNGSTPGSTRTVNYVNLNSSSKVDTSLISEISEGRDGVKVKLHDKMKAMEKIEKYLDLIPDNWKRMVEEEHLALDRERLAIEKGSASKASEKTADMEAAIDEAWRKRGELNAQS
jgi:phage terminase small subunit